MKFSAAAVAGSIGILAVLCASATAAETGLTRHHNPWGRYQPGAWNLVRVTTQTFDGNETELSVMETRTTLVSVDDESVTLTMQAGLKVGGTEMETNPQTVSQGFHGDLSTSEPKTEDLGAGEVVIGNRRVPCRIVRLEFPRPAGRKVAKIYYSDSVEPYILRRETAIYSEGADEPVSETTFRVIALEAPCRIFRNFRVAARVKSVHKDASGTTTTWAWTSSLVPGGVICHTSQQVDNTGRLVSRSDLQVLDYGLRESSSGRSRLFWRWRRSRSR